MALENPSYVQQASSHNASLFRQAAQSMINGTGVVGANDLSVTQNGTPNMSVNVAAGMIWIPGTLGSTTGMPTNQTSQSAYGLPATFTAQGSYCAYQDATVNLGITAADPTNPRFDLIVAAQQDAQYAGSNNQPVLSVVTGTPAPSPAVPAPPASSVVLAVIQVLAGVTSIVTGNILDVRPRLMPLAFQEAPQLTTGGTAAIGSRSWGTIGFAASKTGAWTIASNIVTVQRPGLLMVSFMVDNAVTSDTNPSPSRLLYNGTEICEVGNGTIGGGGWGKGLAMTIPCNVGDTIQVQIFNLVTGPFTYTYNSAIGWHA